MCIWNDVYIKLVSVKLGIEVQMSGFITVKD